MILKGKTVKFKIALELGDKAPPGSIDLIITDPVGHVVYHSAGAAGGVLQPKYKSPAPLVTGSFAFDFIFPEEGLWRIDLDAGNAEDHDLLYTQLVNVIDHQALSESTAYLP